MPIESTKHEDKTFEFASSIVLDGELADEDTEREAVVGEYQRSLDDPPMLAWTAIKEW